ncbi:Gfo/Idh/MocA family protein [Desulfuribacillus alkaliarsenatis]|uniref:Oxidoreductase n=1 Tax=Desulfuribacillus alkaliarsenatis TaxID=766136 RepID=A0A1E5G1U4_9FIRM|nr:oxidoreductase [Desulfuribacillus alkaliarsenatis]
MTSFAVVGCGHIAKKHIQAINNIDNAKVEALCDVNEERIKEFSHLCDAKGYQSLSELFRAHPRIDVVNICTPSGLHKDLTIQAAEAGKHIIVEKPIALTLTDANEMIEACKQNNVKLAVVHPNRFRPAVIELTKAFSKGLFGKISHANSTVRWNRNQEYYDQAAWRGTKAMDGGVLMNQAIHNLDLLLWFMGPIEEIKAYTTTRLRNIESEDVGVAIIKFANGALGVVEAATTIYPENYEESLSIFGETGSAVLSGKTANWIKHFQFQQLDTETSKQVVDKIDKDPYGTPGHQMIIQDMIESIKENRDPIVSGEQGREALKLVLAICQAAEEDNSVNWDSIN